MESPKIRGRNNEGGKWDEESNSTSAQSELATKSRLKGAVLREIGLN